jgi:hypothetical protein
VSGGTEIERHCAMWSRDRIAPAAVAVAVLAAAIALIAVLVLRSPNGHSQTATNASGPKPSKAQQHAAGVLSAFVYERGTWYAGGNVKACQPNWHPAPQVIAQLHCTAFGQPSVYTRFRTGSQASAYFKKLASQGQPGSGDWGSCRRHIPSTRWTRTILGSEKESGQVAFRQSRDRVSVVWIWPDMQTVAEATGRLSQRIGLCRAWNLNA